MRLWRPCDDSVDAEPSVIGLHPRMIEGLSSWPMADMSQMEEQAWSSTRLGRTQLRAVSNVSLTRRTYRVAVPRGHSPRGTRARLAAVRAGRLRSWGGGWAGGVERKSPACLARIGQGRHDGDGGHTVALECERRGRGGGR